MSIRTRTRCDVSIVPAHREECPRYRGCSTTWSMSVSSSHATTGRTVANGRSISTPTGDSLPPSPYVGLRSLNLASFGDEFTSTLRTERVVVAVVDRDQNRLSRPCPAPPTVDRPEALPPLVGIDVWGSEANARTGSAGRATNKARRVVSGFPVRSC